MKKRLMQVVGAICMVLALALTQVPASFVEAISPAAEFERNKDQLISYTGTAKAVSVPAGVKTICEDAFAGNGHLEEITIPSSVRVIENGAFRGCENLEKVNLAEGLEEIGSGAFSLCSKLTNIHLPGTVTVIGAGVFAGDTQLKGIDTSKNECFHCENGVLYDLKKDRLIQYFSSNQAEEFFMPDSVKDVERYAFWGCQNLEKVSLSPYLLSIPEYMFSNCRDLKTVVIPYSVRNIDAKAFEDCVRLKTVSIPLSVTNIHETAFDGCPGVALVTEPDSYGESYYRALKERQTKEKEEVKTNDHTAVGLLYRQGEYDDSISSDQAEDSSAFKRDINDETFLSHSTAAYDPSNPADVSGLDVNAYYANDGDEVVAKTRVVGNEAVIMPSDGFSDKTPYLENAGSEDVFVPDLIISDDGSHKIAKKQYYEDPTLGTVTFDSGITQIDDFAFARSSLTEIVIPQGVTSIGYGAFYHCDNLTNIEIPDTVKDIMPQALEETPYFKQWMSQPGNNDFLVVGDGILIGYKGNQGNVTLPANVKKIAGGVFKDHTEIFKVTISPMTLEIGEEAFFGCINLRSVGGMGHVKKIADRAFAQCPLQQIHIGNDTQWIGLGAYSGHSADAIVFETIQKLPGLSYEQSATRYDNGAYREYPFTDAQVAVINSQVADFDDTIFDEDYLGFRGLVVSLPNGKNNDPKVAKLEYCTLLPQNGVYNLQIPEKVSVDGVSYDLTSADVDAFSPYTDLSKWTDLEIWSILLPDALGQISDYEPELMLGPKSINENSENTTDSQNEQTEEQLQTTTGDNSGSEDDTSDSMQENSAEVVESTNTTTVNLGSTYSPAGKIIGEVLDDTNLYTLYVGTSEQEQDLKDAVSKEYGIPVTGQLSTFDCKLVENATNIPITSLGQNQMKLTVPISQTFYEQEICAVSLDDAGKVQMHFGTKSKQNEEYYFTFYTNHFSAYGIYAGVGEQAEFIKIQSLALQSLDDSPDTGEKINPFLILAIGFVCAGIALLLNGFRKVK